MEMIKCVSAPLGWKTPVWTDRWLVTCTWRELNTYVYIYRHLPATFPWRWWGMCQFQSWPSQTAAWQNSDLLWRQPCPRSFPSHRWSSWAAPQTAPAGRSAAAAASGALTWSLGAPPLHTPLPPAQKSGDRLPEQLNKSWCLVQVIIIIRMGSIFDVVVSSCCIRCFDVKSRCSTTAHTPATSAEI